jgi:flagellar biosynthesis regulator FlbT
MALRMTLKPQEWFMVGNTRVVNIWDDKVKLKIDGAAPILRQAQTMCDQEADTSAKRVYLAVQRLYLHLRTTPEDYFVCVDALLKENPAASVTVAKANAQIAEGSYYDALREYRKLCEAPAG